MNDAHETSGRRRVRVAAIDDHEVVIDGLRSSLAEHPWLEFVGGRSSVESLVADLDPDLVLLDLAGVGDVFDNVTRLKRLGARVFAYTSAEHPYLIREAARAGAEGLIRKTGSSASTVRLIEEHARDEHEMATEFAAAIDADAELDAARLTAREGEVLALYASGEKAVRVARMLGVSVSTIHDTINRVREKYAKLGRDAGTKAHMYARALEDGFTPLPGLRRGERSGS